MKLENQVTSLEISKRLKELGVKQESLYHFVNRAIDGEINFLTTASRFRWEEDFISAFTVAELGEMLPNSIISQEKQKHLQCAKLENGNHRVAYYSLYAYAPKTYISEKTEADARGKMLIYLLENKLITL